MGRASNHVDHLLNNVANSLMHPESRLLLRCRASMVHRCTNMRRHGLQISCMTICTVVSAATASRLLALLVVCLCSHHCIQGLVLAVIGTLNEPRPSAALCTHSKHTALVSGTMLFTCIKMYIHRQMQRRILSTHRPHLFLMASFTWLATWLGFHLAKFELWLMLQQTRPCVQGPPRPIS